MKTLGIFAKYFEGFVYVCVVVILQPIEFITCQSKKTALGSSGYESLTTCTTNYGWISSLPKRPLTAVYERSY